MGPMGPMGPWAAGPALGPVGGCRAWDRPGPWAQAHGPGTWQPPTGSRAGPAAQGPMVPMVSKDVDPFSAPPGAIVGVWGGFSHPANSTKPSLGPP